MNLRAVAVNTSLLLLLLAVIMGVPMGVAIYGGEMRTLLAYGVSGALALVTAAVLRLLGRGAPTQLHRKDALGTVALTWVALGIFGGLPFVIEGSIPDPASALFEAVSGFTTTGATVVSDIDSLSAATNLWRCTMHWVGGMGIVVLFVAIFPQLGVSAKQLFKSEAPGPITEGLRPRIKQTAFALWLIYSGLTALCAFLLWLAGMSVYDAVCHAFSTLGTGGFSTRGASVGGYQSVAIDWIVIIFMFLAALNFGLYYGALKGNWKAFVRNAEFKFFLVVNLAVAVFVTVSILPLHDGDVLESARYGFFQVLSVTSTTGFMTEDFETYPNAVRLALFLLMFMGGSAGSTAGGLKAVRILALIKLAIREVKLVVQPRAIIPVRLGRTVYSAEVLHGILVFAAAFVMIWVIASMVLVFYGLDLVSAMSASIACLASVGPGLNAVGPTHNFGFVPGPAKVVLSVAMIAGRLEIFALLAVFNPQCWRRG